MTISVDSDVKYARSWGIESAVGKIGVDFTKKIESNLSTMEKEAIDQWMKTDGKEFESAFNMPASEIKKHLLLDYVRPTDGSSIEVTLGLDEETWKKNPWFGLPHVEFDIPDGDFTKRTARTGSYDD